MHTIARRQSSYTRGERRKVITGGVEVEKKNYRCHECKECPLAGLCRTKEDAKTGRKVGHDEFERCETVKLNACRIPK